MDYQQLSDALRRLGMMQEASEYHGILTGMLCWQDDVPAGLKLNQDIAVPEDEFTDLRLTLLRSLEGPEMGFTPLLPEDAQPMAERAEALGQWCSGFLYGLASHDGFSPEQTSESTQEAIQDLSAISRAASTDAGQDTEESAWAELVEYVRVVAQVIYLELRSRAS